jgi:hypothetical protein
MHVNARCAAVIRCDWPCANGLPGMFRNVKRARSSFCQCCWTGLGQELKQLLVPSRQNCKAILWQQVSDEE